MPAKKKSSSSAKKSTSQRKRVSVSVHHGTPKKKAIFLKAFARLANVSGAAAAARIGRQTHYNWIAEDPEYQKAFSHAKEEAADRLEQELRRRAIEGTLRPVYHSGRKVGTIREYSDTLGIFLLKGARPEKYRERFEVSGPSGGAIPISVNQAIDKVYGGSGDDQQ